MKKRERDREKGRDRDRQDRQRQRQNERDRGGREGGIQTDREKKKETGRQRKRQTNRHREGERSETRESVRMTLHRHGWKKMLPSLKLVLHLGNSHSSFLMHQTSCCLPIPMISN